MRMKGSRRYHIKEREISQLQEKLPPEVRELIERDLRLGVKVEKVETEKINLYLFNGRPLLAEMVKGGGGDALLPTLAFQEGVELLPKIIVDMGAVPHVCNGADIMGPGVRGGVGVVREGGFVVVLDEKHRKPLALGRVVVAVGEGLEGRRGKVVENLHYVGDEVWRMIQSL